MKLWIDERFSEIQCRPYDYFIEVYLKKVFGLLDDLEQESNKVANNYFESRINQVSPKEVDIEYVIDESFFKGLEYFEMISLVGYNINLMWFSTMYQFWEQQVRLFIYNGGDYRLKNISLEKFCKNIGQIKNEFLNDGIDITKMDCWNDIDELRLLANVIKHGDGEAATKLKSKRPDFFYDKRLKGSTFDLYGTSLNERTLNIHKMQLFVYKDSLQRFWRELYYLSTDEIENVKKKYEDLF